MKEVINVDIVMATCKTEKLAINAIKTFMKFSDGFNFNYYIVENSPNDYGDSLTSLSENVTWVQNDDGRGGSSGLSSSLEKGLSYCKSKYVFFCHADIIACNPNWMSFLIEKLEKENYSVTSFHGHWGYSNWHNERIDACHPGGILTYTELAKKVSLAPIYKDGILLWDSAATLTKHCIENDLKYYWCKNTVLEEYNDTLGKPPFDSLGRVIKCFDDDGDVIFLHLRRGVPRETGKYTKVKKGIVTINDWFEFTNNHIL